MTEAQLQSLWRETEVPLTWNSPVCKQFYETVRQINQNKLCRHPIRILLADPPLDWAKIHTARELAPWSDRDASYAAVVERQVLAKHHRALLVAGRYHAAKQMQKADKDDVAAAQLIARKYPGSLFSIVVAPPSAARTIHLDRPPSFKIVKGSGLEATDFSLIAKTGPDKWPPVGKVFDGILNVGEQTSVYPSPKIYLDPVYQRELRRRAAIITDYSGQDFVSVIEELIKEGRKGQ